MSRMTRDGVATPPGALAHAGDDQAGPAARRREMTMFLVLAFVIWPFIAVAVVGGFGFLVWMWQIVAGPPGPPVH